MKLAIILPGYLDSSDYLHIKIISKRFVQMGFVVETPDPCGLWKNDDMENYSVSNYLKQILTIIDSYKNKSPEEIILIGHSLGGLISIIAGNLRPEINKIVALCSPDDLANSQFKWVNKEPRLSKRDLPDNPEEFRIFKIPHTYIEDAQKYSVINEVQKLKQPLMILFGLQDEIVPLESLENLVSHANNPYVVRIPYMGHSIRKSEEDCNLVMEEIRKFLFLTVMEH